VRSCVRPHVAVLWLPLPVGSWSLPVATYPPWQLSGRCREAARRGPPGGPVPATRPPGARLNANLTGCDADYVKIGMQVQVEWTPIADGWVLPNFRKVPA
jgi:hypothetical protein